MQPHFPLNSEYAFSDSQSIKRGVPQQREQHLQDQRKVLVLSRRLEEPESVNEGFLSAYASMNLQSVEKGFVVSDAMKPVAWLRMTLGKGL